MDELTAAEAAAYLGITREAVDAAAREGRLPALDGDGPRRFTKGTLEGFHLARMQERIAALARSRETPVSVARRVRKTLHADELGMPRPFTVRLAAMPIAWRSLFSKAELAAACVRDGEGCRWCEARKFGAVLGLRPVEFSPALRELFGADPCGVCAPVLLRPCMAALAARVHAGDRRPAGPSPRPSEAEREAAREWAVRHPVTAAARPVGDDGGKAAIQRRRREVQARLKAANRAGDRAYAEQLARQLMELRADAAAADGRRSLKSRPGVLRCGHLLAANCSCPRASKRVTS
jgi:hypothetical protein